MPTPRKFKAGDKVTPIHNDEFDRVPTDTLGRVFTVDKVNPKKLRARADDGGRGINFPDELLVPATDENVKAGREAILGVRPFQPREFFDVGEIVSLKKGRADWPEDAPLMVMKDGDKVNVTKVGGYQGRYLRANPLNLVKRDLAWLRDWLQANDV